MPFACFGIIGVQIVKGPKMNNRRQFMIVAGASLLLPGSAIAQQNRPARIGILGSSPGPHWDTFTQELTSAPLNHKDRRLGSKDDIKSNRRLQTFRPNPARLSERNCFRSAITSMSRSVKVTTHVPEFRF